MSINAQIRTVFHETDFLSMAILYASAKPIRMQAIYISLLQLVLCAGFGRVAGTLSPSNVNSRRHLSPHSAKRTILRSGTDRYGETFTTFCNLSQARYVASQLEIQWADMAPNITNAEQYCALAGAFTARSVEWLEAAKQVDLASTRVVPANHSRDDVLSRFEYEWTCGQTTTVHASFIEPLAGSLRHPQGWCGPVVGEVSGNFSEVLYDFLVPDVANSPVSKAGTKFIFDLGARTFGEGVGLAPDGTQLPAQRYLTEAYARRGIVFDRMLLWDAQPEDAATIWEHVPKKLLPSYQYINMPVSAGDEMTNPLRVIKALCAPEDFVVLKLDIDNVDLEQALLSQLLADPELQGLIDEMYYEWNPTEAGWSSMSQAYKMFHALRSAGMRAHGWI